MRSAEALRSIVAFAKRARLVPFCVLLLLPHLALAIIVDPDEIAALKDLCLSWKNSSATGRGYFANLNCTNSTDLGLFCDKSFSGISCNPGHTSFTYLCVSSLSYTFYVIS